MKRTPVLIDVNGVPLRESLSYNGGGAGFGGQMAEWLPPAQSADAALLPALRLGNEPPRESWRLNFLRKR